MHDFITILKVLEHINNKKNFREIENLTGVSKSTCSLWKQLYHNNYINLQKRYLKNHHKFDQQWRLSLEPERLGHHRSCDTMAIWGIYLQFKHK